MIAFMVLHALRLSQRFALELFDFFPEFDEHGEQDRFKGKGVTDLAYRGGAMPRPGKEGVKSALFLFAEGARKIGKGLFFGEDELVGRDGCAWVWMRIQLATCGRAT